MMLRLTGTSAASTCGPWVWCVGPVWARAMSLVMSLLFGLSLVVHGCSSVCLLCVPLGAPGSATSGCAGVPLGASGCAPCYSDGLGDQPYTTPNHYTPFTLNHAALPPTPGRCVKPNPESQPGSLVPEYVLEQLRWV